MDSIRLLPAENDTNPDEAFYPSGLPLVPRKEPSWGPFRSLDEKEIADLESRGNRSANWSLVTVAEGFSSNLVEQCRFTGKVRIGALKGGVLDHHDLRLPVGLYRSCFEACDIGPDVAIHNVGILSRVVVEPHCLLFNIGEWVTTNHSKFGNGTVTHGESDEVRIHLELANENGGRRILAFDGILPGDAWMWSKYRADRTLMNRFQEMTDAGVERRRGAYGRIGEASVVKECRILKDVKIGRGAYIKGANKLKNLTVNSDAQRPTQIGEGVELVNGIIGYGCRVFYGAKAVRFVLADHSHLKYGARLLNSYLGHNSTISCCEVLNSLIFPGHEQHHNSSFLCASTLMGQSNIASAATVGSNHNSRAPDGEIRAGRGFWPGLGTSLKHDSVFASFTLVAKGNYPAEIANPLPFCLIANDEAANELILHPGYWFRYNMYALARNAWKYGARDARIERTQFLDFDWLAPDTVNEMRGARKLLEKWAGGVQGLQAEGDLGEDSSLFIQKVENSRRRTRVVHPTRAWEDYGRMIRFYALRCLMEEAAANHRSLEKVASDLKDTPVGDWENLGGQLVPAAEAENLRTDIKNGRVASWEEVHHVYKDWGSAYRKQRLQHAWEALLEVEGTRPGTEDWRRLTAEAGDTARFIRDGVERSRRKDYENPFRNLTYDSKEERDQVLGPLKDNDFIKQTALWVDSFIAMTESLSFR